EVPPSQHQKSMDDQRQEGEDSELDDTAGSSEPRLRDTPEDILFEAAVNTIAFHPSQDILAAGDVEGDVFVYSYSCWESGNKELWSSGHHLKSCRDSAFTSDGQREIFSLTIWAQLTQLTFKLPAADR
uniref:WD repeat domain 55 n=1 Tax=Xenopus tropicalis TaxID=8364 RepID=A0A803J967_XENTR